VNDGGEGVTVTGLEGVTASGLLMRERLTDLIWNARQILSGVGEELQSDELWTGTL
jgi:hypothetical protein